jgi:hypothetical protein
MPLRVLAIAAAGIEEHRGGWCRSGKSPIIADIGPHDRRSDPRDRGDGPAAEHEKTSANRRRRKSTREAPGNDGLASRISIGALEGAEEED